jgi:plastocyanin
MARRFVRNAVWAHLVIVVTSAVACAADWGSLKGRFLLDGPPPEQPKLQINKDAEFCGKHEPRSETLVVHREDRGIANVVIWLDSKPGEKVAIHPSYDATATAQVRLANRACRFDPHICVLRTGQTLVIENPDQVDHNTAAGLDKNDPFNALTPAGKSSERPRFKQAERLPALVQCSIHPWMTGWLVVKDHPYVAVTDEHGRFELKNLPAGEHTFVVWHELPNYVQEVTRGGQTETWKRGKVTIRVSVGESDFGEVRLTAEVLK